MPKRLPKQKGGIWKGPGKPGVIEEARAFEADVLLHRVLQNCRPGTECTRLLDDFGYIIDPIDVDNVYMYNEVPGDMRSKIKIMSKPYALTDDGQRILDERLTHKFSSRPASAASRPASAYHPRPSAAPRLPLPPIVSASMQPRPSSARRLPSAAAPLLPPLPKPRPSTALRLAAAAVSQPATAAQRQPKYLDIHLARKQMKEAKLAHEAREKNKINRRR